jgi:hypothetical protein
MTRGKKGGNYQEFQERTEHIIRRGEWVKGGWQSPMNLTETQIKLPQKNVSKWIYENKGKLNVIYSCTILNSGAINSIYPAF